MRTKYHSRKVTIDGITFDSKKEGDYFCQLKLLLRGGVVKGFNIQVEYELLPGFYHAKKYYRPIKYRADFVVFYADGHVEVVDVKGFRTKEYLLKKKLLLAKYPDIVFVEV